MESSKQEDLDILYVIRGIKRSILHFFKSIAALVLFSLKNIWTILIFVVIALAVFLSFYAAKKPYYSSQLSISHIRINNDYCKEMVDNLNSYIDGGANQGIIESLGVSAHLAQQIQNIEYAPLNENIEKRFADSVSVLLPFKVLVEVYELEILDTLQIAILNYFESNEFALTRKKLEHDEFNKTEERVKKEIIEIDSLKQLVSKSIVPRGTGSGIILGEPIDPVLVYRRGLELFERQLQLSKKQTLNDSFELMVGFNKSAKRADLGIELYIFLGLLFGYISALLWLVRAKTNGKT